MSSKHGKRYTPRFKFQVVMETIKSSKTIGQIARAYGVHPITIHTWRKEFMEKGPELFGQKTTIHEYEKKIRELEQLIGHKEVEIALLKNFLTGASSERRKSS
jgi:transposase